MPVRCKATLLHVAGKDLLPLKQGNRSTDTGCREEHAGQALSQPDQQLHDRTTALPQPATDDTAPTTRTRHACLMLHMRPRRVSTAPVFTTAVLLSAAFPRDSSLPGRLEMAADTPWS